MGAGTCSEPERRQNRPRSGPDHRRWDAARQRGDGKSHSLDMPRVFEGGLTRVPFGRGGHSH